MAELREAFGACGGDYEATMARFMGNEKLYLKLLDMLFQDQNLDKLGGALTRGDLDAAFEAAHTLKGVASNMGLDALTASVCAIVEPLRSREAREDYPALYQAVQAEFKRVEAMRDQVKGGESS